MNWAGEPATENQPRQGDQSGLAPDHSLTQGEVLPFSTTSEGHSSNPGTPEGKPGQPPAIRIGRTIIGAEGKDIGIFTMTLGEETIQLLPLKNWGQLDIHKWTVRGKLPGTPAGLEVAFDHVKIAGETVSAKDPDGCSKLEKLFSEWLALEKETLELARKKAHSKPLVFASEQDREPANEAVRFLVEVDKEDQVHIKCCQGKETTVSIGLNLPGFNSLFSQGLMRKPRSLKVGALHDWIELDGVLYSFEKGNNDAAKLAQALNEAYAPTAAHGENKDVRIFANPASSTGFDIQFPVIVGGVSEHRRRPLNEESLELLQDANHCGLLQQGIVVKLTRPTFIFKQKTADGGERYLPKCAENMVHVKDEDGQERVIDLSQPVNYLHLSTMELTAVLNHPAINKHGKASPGASGPSMSPAAARSAEPVPRERSSPPQTASLPARIDPTPVEAKNLATYKVTIPAPERAPQVVPDIHPAPAAAQPTAAVRPLPNLWLKEILAQQPIRHDWLTCLIYGKIAERFHNSSEGEFGLGSCWAVSLGEISDVADPGFKGIFLTEKGGFGFSSRGMMARFNKGVAFLGTQESAIEGFDVNLIGVGLDAEQRVVFIVNEGYRTKFGVTELIAAQELAGLRQGGGVVASVQETLNSSDCLEVVWTVPAIQEHPNDPKATEHVRPPPRNI